MNTPTPTPAPETHADTSLTEQAKAFKHVMKVDAILFVGIIFLALLGVGITNYRGSNAHTYWTYLLVLLALVTSAWGAWRSKRLGVMESGKLLFEQAILWGGALVAVAVIYRLLDTGRVNYETTGLLILLVLTLTTFVDGMLVSWKLYVVSALLLFSLLMAMYVGQLLWMIVLVALVLIGLVLAYVIWKIRSH
jgi:uncharacterized membrane protein